MSNFETNSQTSLNSCVKALGIPSIQRHVFLCADQTNPKCCEKEIGLNAWNYLKQRLKELKLDQPPEGNLVNQVKTQVFRTKANCLRVCQQGPILVVYPEGVWYHSAVPDVIEQIIQIHLINNQILSEYVFLIHPLPTTQLLPSGVST